MVIDKQQERLVKREVNKAIKFGRKPENISISARKNPSLKKWAKRKGINFSSKQKVDILY